MGTLYVRSQANTGSLFRNRIITTESNLFLFRKYTNHLQVLFASVFIKLSWQAYVLGLHKTGKWVGMNQCFCVCVWRKGPAGEAGPFTSAHKMAAVAALFVGDNGPESKTGSLLRGNAEPASELIKQLSSESAACLMSDTVRGILAVLRSRKKNLHL